MSCTARITEIFSSLQGEGTRAGEPMTFVRFAGCGLDCRYCDTPQGLSAGEQFRIEDPPRSGRFVQRRNPATAEGLLAFITAFPPDEALVLTGGEPLEQADFLASWLPSLKGTRRTLLETNGIHHRELERIIPLVDIISMDVKLPSFTGKAPRWEEHEAFLFLAAASNCEFSIKAVVAASTTDEEIDRAAGIVARAGRAIPFILQPASPTARFDFAPTPARLAAIRRRCEARLPDVRVVPQMHKRWGVL